MDKALIIKNIRLLSTFDPVFYIPKGWLYIDSSKIQEFGEGDPPIGIYSRRMYQEVFDGENLLCLPGFINTHMHLYSTFARGMQLKEEPPKNFYEILKKLWWKLDKGLFKEAVYLSALYSVIESVRCGTTSIIDHHASPNFIIGSLGVLEKALTKVGLRSVLSYEVTDRNGKDEALEGINENIKFIKRIEADISNVLTPNTLTKAQFGLHASFTLSDSTLKTAKSALEGRDVGFHIHVAEDKIDEEDSLDKYKKRVVTRLKDLEILSNKTIAAHCVHVDDEEISILKNTDTIVVHNPESNMGNAVGYPPLKSFLNNEILVGLGTDGYTPSMIETIKVANALYKHSYKDPSSGFDEMRKIFLINNPLILKRFFDEDFGVIKEGAKADLVFLDYYPPTPIDEKNFFSHMLFGFRENLVNSIIIDGKFAMKKGKILEVDEKDFSKEAQEVAKKVWNNI